MDNKNNTGKNNTGNSNTGNSNTGNNNTGTWNTGNNNTGNRNTGDWNTGNSNTGDWNTGNSNTGYFNLQTSDKINIFDIPTDRKYWENCDKPNFIYFELTLWIPASDMTDEEKENNDSYGNTGGYLKKLDYKEAFKQSYEKANNEDRKKIFNIPNFDADNFLEISGIDVRVDSDREAKKSELIKKANELLEQAKKM